jgi:hypothetical protein
MKLANLNKQKESLKKDENLTSGKSKHERKRDMAYKLSGIDDGNKPGGPLEDEKGDKREEKENISGDNSFQTPTENPDSENLLEENLPGKVEVATPENNSEENKNSKVPTRSLKIPVKLQWLHELDKRLYNTYQHSNMDIVRTTSAKIDTDRLALLKEYSLILGIDSQEVLALAIDFFREKYDGKIEEIRKLRKSNSFKN